MHEKQSATPFDAALFGELERLRAENAALRAQVAQLLQRVQDLEARLAKDSHNSSKPPSSDPPFNPGATMGLVDEPDRTVFLPLTGHCDCGCCRAGILASALPERRQVTERVIRREVTEYRILEGVCICGQVHRSAFPPGMDAAVQYGPGVYALAVHLTQYQLLPYQRTAALLDELAGIAISPATIHAAVRSAAMRVQAQVATIGQALARAAVAHADETGVRVDGKLNWLHVLSTDTLTTCFVPAKRGQAALDAFGLLAHYTGILVHDHWCAYDCYPGLHAFCNAHPLRELIGLIEGFPEQSWAAPMIDLLCQAKEAADQARAQGLAALPTPALEQFQARYDTILTQGAALNPRNTQRTGTRGRIKHSPAYNLLGRLRERRDDTLRFLTDLRVPFDNNQAERDVRMPKVKQKVSGGFRSSEGAAAFATIRSYLSTLRKQSADLFHALVMTFQGAPPMPRLG